MIAHLDGTVESVEEDIAIIDVGGVGYEVHIGRILGLTEGVKMRVYTVQQFKEDGVIVFGFGSPDEVKLFKTITSKVSGVGGKIALSILRSLTPSQIADAVVHERSHVFRAIPGIGPKMSERIVLELRDVMASVAFTTTSISGDQVDEARVALRSLGFSIGEVEKALSGLKQKELTSEEIIKQALGKLSK